MNAQDTSAEPTPDLQLEIAHILLMDVVGYSKLLVNEQIELLQELKQIVRSTECFRAAEARGELIRVPTGDGMALIFFHSPEEPVRCALEISKALQDHPSIHVRMGIHSGPVGQVTDVNDRTNIAGAGINVAQRVLDCGDAGHILLSAHVAEDLCEYRHWQPYLDDLGECEVKYGLRLHLFNLYKDGLGNPQVPEKLQPGGRKQAAVTVRPISAPRWPKYVLSAVLLVSAVALAISFSVFYRRGSPAVARSSSGKAAAVGLPIAEKSIAVLPFENRSEDKANAYFADGIQDEILSRLSKIADLKVTSRTSTQHYKSAPENLPAIARELGVAHIVEGSVQKSGNAVRVSVRLIKATNDSQLWADTFDRKLTDIFSVETDVAKAIADQLQAKLTGQEEQVIASKPTDNPEAYDAYLQAVAIDDAQTLDTTKRAADLYTEAVRLDPQFALAWARLAVARSQLYFNGTDLETNSGSAVKEAANRAMSLQPELGEAWLAEGVYRYRVLRDFQGALQAYEEAFRRLPNSAFVLKQMAHLERRRGQFDVAQEHYQAAAQLDPRNIGILLTLADSLQSVRHYDEARAVFDRALEISSGNETALGAKALTFQAEGRLNEAAEVLAKASANSQDEALTFARAQQLYLERRFDAAIAYIQQNIPTALANDPRQVTLIGYCQKFAGKDDEARATFTRAAAAIKPTPDSVVVVDARNLPCYLAQVYAGLGETEKALDQARQAITDYDNDALVKPFAEASLAIVQAQTGHIDSAISALPHLLEVPDGETCGDLQINPLWDPLRSDPRFQKLCEEKQP